MLETSHVAVPNCSLAVVRKCPEKKISSGGWAYLVSIPMLAFGGRNWAKWIICEISDFRSTFLASQSVVGCKNKSYPVSQLTEDEIGFVREMYPLLKFVLFFPFPREDQHTLHHIVWVGWEKDYVIDGKNHKKCTQILATARAHRFYVSNHNWTGFFRRIHDFRWNCGIGHMYRTSVQKVIR